VQPEQQSSASTADHNLLNRLWAHTRRPPRGKYLSAYCERQPASRQHIAWRGVAWRAVSTSSDTFSDTPPLFALRPRAQTAHSNLGDHRSREGRYAVQQPRQDDPPSTGPGAPPEPQAQSFGIQPSISGVIGQPQGVSSITVELHWNDGYSSRHQASG
jgi:hypothetical protein